MLEVELAETRLGGRVNSDVFVSARMGGRCCIVRNQVAVAGEVLVGLGHAIVNS